jgi:hypothetical protein
MWTKQRRGNVEVNVAWKGKQKFLGLEEGKTMVKMRKPRKKGALLAN